jgi:hypothetical protein
MRTALWFFFLLVLTACAPAGSSIDQATPAETGKNTPILVFERSGGFSGMSETWEIYPDGRMLAGSEENSQKLSEKKVEQIRALFLDADLEAINQAGPASACADCFTIRMTWIDESRKIEVTVVPEASDADPAALELVRAVEALLFETP